MTAAELLIPRVIVTADYPNSPFKIGDILTWDGIIWSMNEPQKFVGYLIPEHNPHLFKPLNWWEKRTVEEMPKKVFSKAFKGSENDVIEIQEWDMELLIGWINKKEKTCCSIRSWNPEFGYFPID